MRHVQTTTSSDVILWTFFAILAALAINFGIALLAQAQCVPLDLNCMNLP